MDSYYFNLKNPAPPPFKNSHNHGLYIYLIHILDINQIFKNILLNKQLKFNTTQQIKLLLILNEKEIQSNTLSSGGYSCLYLEKSLLKKISMRKMFIREMLII